VKLIGDKLPDLFFEVYEPLGNKVEKRSFKSFEGKYLILFFYPADFTFVCPTELRDLTRRKEDFARLNASVLVASTDTAYTHKAWLEEEGLLKDFQYPMIADRNCAIARALGVLNEGSGNARRATFIVDPDGRIRAEYTVDDNIGRNAGEIVRLLKAIKFVRENPGSACPASWDETQPSLRPSLEMVGKVAAALGERRT